MLRRRRIRTDEVFWPYGVIVIENRFSRPLVGAPAYSELSTVPVCCAHRLRHSEAFISPQSRTDGQSVQHSIEKSGKLPNMRQSIFVII